MKAGTLAALVFFLGVGVLVAADEAKKIVGTWEVTKAEGAPPGATVEFTKDGKMAMRAKLGDKLLEIKGTYKIEGTTINSTLSFMGKTKSDKSTIKELTDKKLVIADGKGRLEEYKRVK